MNLGSRCGPSALLTCENEVMGTRASSPSKQRARRLVRDGWISNQHGAWAMMLVPVIVGSLLGGLAWQQLLLLVAWLAAFFYFSALGLWVKVYSSARARARAAGKPLGEARLATIRKRQGRFRNALVAYAAVAAVGALSLLILKPSLALWAPAFAVCFGIALWEMWNDNERGLLSRASAIIASQFLTPIAFSLGSHPDDWGRAWLATAILTLYFIGTVPLVKTLIRERGSSAWLIGSLTFHGVVLAVTFVAALLGHLNWWIVALWALLLIRAAAFPAWSYRTGKPLRPAIIGFSEIAVSTTVVLVLTLPTTLT